MRRWSLRQLLNYTKSLKVRPMGPSPRSNRHDEPRAFNQLVPIETAMIEDVFIVGEDPVGEPIIAHVLYCQMFSTGLSSGDLDGRGTSVIFSGTSSLAVTWHPARSTNRTA